MPPPNHLVAGQALGKIVVQRRFIQRTTLPRDDESGRHLAGFRVGRADDAAVGDVGMFEQRRLELGRRDAERTALDHLLLAIDEVGVAVLIDVADVAAVEPAVAQGLCGLVGALVVAVHELGSAQDELT